MQPRLLLVLERIPMVPYKDKVALVVERHDLVTFELRLVLKQRAQETTHAVAQTRGKVVQNQLGLMVRASTSFLDALCQFHVRHFKERRRTFW